LQGGVWDSVRNDFGIFLMWWNRVFAGVFANCGAQNVVFCMVNVVQMWRFVWLKLQQNGAETMGQAFAIYFERWKMRASQEGFWASLACRAW
jgi:hypothetical protein